MTSTLKRGERTMPLRELTSAAAVPLATVTANLMPPEVIAKRRLNWLKRRLASTLIALIVVVGLAYGLSFRQTGSAEDELATTQSATDQLMTDAHRYDELVQTQVQIKQTAELLRAVLAGSLDWSALLTSLNRAAPPGLHVDQVGGQLGDDTAGTTTAATTPAAGTPDAAVGTLTLSGSARDYRSIARFVDTLSKVKGLAQVEPGGATSAGGKATFEITASLTKDALTDLQKLFGGK